ncbi:MAG: alpha/beta hydrolase [Nocardioides sp.]
MTTDNQRQPRDDESTSLGSLGHPHLSIAASADGTSIGYQSLGSGPDAILVGGALSCGADYLPLARLLGESLRIHVMDRRGRGASGAQGPAYDIERECQDLLAVQRQTGARAVFGHSYGGLVALETARRTDSFERLAVYEPGVSVAGSMPVGWLGECRRRLDSDDPRGAFAVMARGAGHAPAFLTRAPFGFVRALMHTMPRGQWRHLEALLPTALAENDQIAQLDAPDASRFASISAPVLLLGGTKSPEAITLPALRALHDALPDSQLRLVEGLEHTAPTRRAPKALAERLTAFLSSP